MDEPISEPKRYQCRHIFTAGNRCGSPCLRNPQGHEEFCYHHHTTRLPIANPRKRRARQSTFEIPLPEDRAAIQLTIGQVLRRVASNDLDPRRAGLLLYGLQIAAMNLPRTIQSTRNSQPAAELIEEIVQHPTLGTLAPIADYIDPKTRNVGFAGLLLEALRKQPPPSNVAPPPPAIIPNIQATAALPREDPALDHASKASSRPTRSPMQRSPHSAFGPDRSSQVILQAFAPAAKLELQNAEVPTHPKSCPSARPTSPPPAIHRNIGETAKMSSVNWRGYGTEGYRGCLRPGRPPRLGW